MNIRFDYTVTRACLISLLGLFVTTPALSDDWPSWMGPDRDGVYHESGIIESIPADGLPVRWRKQIAGGYAGPAVADGVVYVFDYEKRAGESFNKSEVRATLEGNERLTAWDVKSGQQLWQHSYDCPYSIAYPAGPRCTPTIYDGKVYLLGSEGDLHCLNAKDGEVLWHRNFKRDFDAKTPLWGFCAHPLVDGNLLYCMVGGAGQGVVALNRTTGEVVWKALDADAGYCPPKIIQAGGQRQLIVFHPTAVESLNPADGAKYWNIPIKPDYEMSIAQPAVEGDLMYVSAIKTQAIMLQLANDKPAVKELWVGGPKNAVHCSNSTGMFVDGVVYGTDCEKGSLIAMDSKDGTRLWETFAATKPDEKRRVDQGTAFLTRIGDTNRFLIMSETGDLILANLTPQAYEELGRFHVLEPTGECFGRSVVWSHPAYANQTAFVRNDKELVAVDISK